MRLAAIASVSLLLACASHRPAQAQAPRSAGDWTAYGKDVFGSRHSGLTQIDTTNVARLAVAWTYHTGDISDGSRGGCWKVAHGNHGPRAATRTR